MSLPVVLVLGTSLQSWNGNKRFAMQGNCCQFFICIRGDRQQVSYKFHNKLISAWLLVAAGPAGAPWLAIDVLLTMLLMVMPYSMPM